MKTWMVLIASAAAALGGPAALAAGQGVNQAAGTSTAPAGRNLEWPSPPRSGRYRVGNILLTMRNRVSGQDSEILDRILTIEAPGYPAFTIDSGEEDAYPPEVMVVETPDRSPMIMYQTFSGGAHCCTSVKLITPRNGRFEAVEVYAGDGGPGDEAPRDIDGDGVIDIVRYDNAFLYTFASYAESFAPPTVTNVIDGQAVDVSSRPGFRSLFEEEAARARETCVGTEVNRNGACAAYVAASARIGRFDEAWAEMLRHHDRNPGWELPQGCRGPLVDGSCPEANLVRHENYPDALRDFLVQQGYIDR